MLLSAFRVPVNESAFGEVFRADIGGDALNASIASLDDEAFGTLVQRLVGYRILRHERGQGRYTAHPLIRGHYSDELAKCDQGQTEALHELIKEYYLGFTEDLLDNPTLEDLAPAIEAVHHACKAGNYDEGHEIWLALINQGKRFLLTWELGAYGTELEVSRDFFPAGDIFGEPYVTSDARRGWILNSVGLGLASLGRQREAVSLVERALAINLLLEDWQNASRANQVLSELQVFGGNPEAAGDAASSALMLARRMDVGRVRKVEERDSLSLTAWCAHLRGEVESAGAAFQEAEDLARKLDPELGAEGYLYSGPGFYHARHLRTAGEHGYARRVAEANILLCRRVPWPDDLSLSLCVLGDLDADDGEDERARECYDEAVRTARGISRRNILLEALSTRGRWVARRGDAPAALSDLEEGLSYAVDGGYRVYEADIRVGLAWARHASGDDVAARSEAERAQRMSVDMGYRWGQVDAAEVLATLSSG